MGQEHHICYPAPSVPTWDAIRNRLLEIGVETRLVMIDGVPAFPDESPGEAWRELRLSSSSGMVTLLRTRIGLSCVIWSNSDAALHRTWKQVVWACASVGEGVIQDSSTTVSAVEFARSNGLA